MFFCKLQNGALNNDRFVLLDRGTFFLQKYAFFIYEFKCLFLDEGMLKVSRFFWKQKTQNEIAKF